ncbi:META domain-containing protein [Gordonia spumicola]|uniref:META domain-containing protein n=1 Tax=Gordonia spumicola TaxID=589161 RepID=A0A7I9VDJ6_9ACTN|nr:META domain-containing protein [Gordonia spumicola]
MLALVAAASLALAACGSDSSGSTSDPAALVGKTYVSDEATDRVVPGGGPLTVAFGENGQISVNGGCNGQGGTATFDGDTMTVGPMVGTMMACPPPHDTVDAWITKLFGEPLTWSLDSRTLTLTRGDQRISLNERVTRAIAGTTWTVTALVRNEAVESSAVLDRVKPTLRIGGDGVFTGFTGCNQMRSDATVTGSGSDQTIRFGAIATTRKMCAPEVTDVERAVLAVLDGDVTAEVDGDSLRLTNVKDSTIGLRLTATPATEGK